MSGMDIMRLDALPSGQRAEATAVLVGSFFHQLSALSKDEGRWRRAFDGALDPDRFWVALLGGEVVGVVGCSDDTSRSIHTTPRQLRGALGPLTGTIAGFVVRSELQSKLRFGEGVGYVECVATKASARRKGVATALLSRMMADAPYAAFVLEVVDTNPGAIRVYERLGFVEYERKKARNPKQMGFNERINMRREKG